MTRPAQRFFLGICAILAAAGVLVPVVLALLGTEKQLLFAWKDDGFYYLTLARSIANGLGPTFDGLGPTNGFHPLWTFLLVPIFWLTHGSVFTPVRITILVATLLHLGASLAVYRAARHLTDREAARFAALFFLGNPLAVYLVVSGMESPLAALLVALLAGEAVLLRRGITRIDERGSLLRIGILGGLSILTRTDLVLLVGVVLAGAVLLPPEEGRSRLGPRFRGSLLSGAVMLALIAPWLVWNLVRFGTVVQVSARAHHLHSVSQRIPGMGSGLASLWSLGPSLLRSLFDRIVLRTGLPAPLLLLVVLLVLAVLLVWVVLLVRGAEVRRDLRKRFGRILSPLVYAAGFLFAAFFVLGHIRSWYIAGPLAVAAILASIPVFYAFGRTGRAGRTGLGGIGRFVSGLVFLGIVLGTAPLWVVFGTEIVQNARGISPWQEASEWVRAHTRPDDRVASFNSGTFGYLTPRTVVNLDCVVNNRAISWLERRELVEYLQRDRIRFVIDDPGYAGTYFRSYAKKGWQARVVPIEDLRSGLRVYEVR